MPPSTLFFATLCTIIPFYLLPVGPFIIAQPILLFLSIQRFHLSFFMIFCWALITTIFEYLPIIDALIYMAPDPTILVFVPGILLTLYTTSVTTIWLLGTQKYITGLSFDRQLAAWAVSFWSYLLFKDQAQFFIFDRCEGNLFSNPLIALSYYPWLITPLCMIPQWLALAWFAAISSLIIRLLIKPSKAAWLVFIILISPWLSIPRAPSPPPAWLNTIGHLPITISPNASLGASSALLAHELSKLKQQFSHLSTVILPESAWNGTCLTDMPHIPILQANPIPDLLIGSFYQNKKKYYNTVYHYYEGTLAALSQKRHALPLTERPIALPWCKNLYFEKSFSICCSQATKPLITLKKQNFSAVIYICSELFFNNKPDDPYNCPIIAVVNDWWFRMPHYCLLMAHAARLRALQWQRGILYVSYKHAYYFDTAGKSYPLITCSQSHSSNL